MTINTAAGILAQYIKETLPRLVDEKAKLIENNIRIPSDGVGISNIEFIDGYILIKLTNGEEFNKLLPFDEIEDKVNNWLTSTKLELIKWSNEHLQGKDGRDGKDGLDGRDGKDGLDGKDGNGIKDIKIDNAGRLTIYTDNKTYDLGIIKKKVNISKGGGGSDSSAIDFTYTNSLPMPSPVGGFPAGTTFNKMPLHELLTGLLYAASYPSFEYFYLQNVNNLEVGDKIEGNFTAKWYINNDTLLQANTISIYYDDLAMPLALDLANTGSHVVTIPEIRETTATSVQFSITAFNTSSFIFSKTFLVKFMFKVYYGETEVEDLTSESVPQLRASELKENVNGEYQFNGGGYKWICYPFTQGERTKFFDVNTGFDVEMEDYVLLIVENQFNVSTLYYCYRTYYELGGAIRIAVSE